jgi:hypothetical protein
MVALDAPSEVVHGSRACQWSGFVIGVQLAVVERGEAMKSVPSPVSGRSR